MLEFAIVRGRYFFFGYFSYFYFPRLAEGTG